MSSPILGDSPSLHERPEREQIQLKDMPLKKHNTSFPMNTPTDLNPVVPGDRDSPGWPSTSSYRTPFSLDGIPASSNFVNRPSDTADLEKYLLPHRSHSRQIRKVFVLYGLGGAGKIQLAIDFALRHQTTVLNSRNPGRVDRQLLHAPGGAQVGVVLGWRLAESRVGKAGARGGRFLGADAGIKGVLGPPAEASPARGEVCGMDARSTLGRGCLEAEEMYERALEGIEKALGPDHTSTLYLA
ncbi:hypothetical protein AUP68_10411 [Ilyonectria robusta]